MEKAKVPPFEDTDERKMLSTLKVSLIRTDNPNITMYMRRAKDVPDCYIARNPDPSTIHDEKMLYVYLEGFQAFNMTPLFVDKYGVQYEPYRQ